ncbi:MAG: hypothetical protein HOW73_51085 [Polyangiaceae bacterium]|nr:hypothetical protein [Polyangiaceae bacterium]
MIRRSPQSVRVIKEADGRLAARTKAMPTCVGYGSTDAEALSDYFAVRTELERRDAPVLEQEGGVWTAQSRRYPGCVGRGDRPSRAIAEVRKMEARASGAQLEDYRIGSR